MISEERVGMKNRDNLGLYNDFNYLIIFYLIFVNLYDWVFKGGGIYEGSMLRCGFRV